jgi:(2Fe-2S) ferredoxin|tara:strand:- start:3910 stop:4269 length:360 start_codon:yes stop_codon:yes gene_type:complete
MSVQRVSHHLLLCATPSKVKCCNPGEGLATWNELKRLIKEFGLENSDRPEGVVLRSKVDCLRICEKGPILLIWPDGIWYTDVTADKIKPIIVQHILNQEPIQQWILKKTPFQHNDSDNQ